MPVPSAGPPPLLWPVRRAARPLALYVAAHAIDRLPAEVADGGGFHQARRMGARLHPPWPSNVPPEQSPTAEEPHAEPATAIIASTTATRSQHHRDEKWDAHTYAATEEVRNEGRWISNRRCQPEWYSRHRLLCGRGIL